MTIQEFYDWAVKNGATKAEILYSNYDYNTGYTRFENSEPWLLSSEAMDEYENFGNKVRKGHINRASMYVRLIEG